MSTAETCYCYRHPGPRDGALLLGMRPADLHRLHDVRRRSASAAPTTRAPARRRCRARSRAARCAARRASRSRPAGARHEVADRDQRRDLPLTAVAGQPGLTHPGGRSTTAGALRAVRRAWRLVSARSRRCSCTRTSSTSASTCTRSARSGRRSSSTSAARATSGSTSSRGSPARPARSCRRRHPDRRRLGRDLRDPRRDAHPRVAGRPAASPVRR